MSWCNFRSLYDWLLGLCWLGCRFVVRFLHGLLEIPDAFAEAFGHFRKFLAAKQHQEDDRNHDDLAAAQVKRSWQSESVVESALRLPQSSL